MFIWWLFDWLFHFTYLWLYDLTYLTNWDYLMIAWLLIWPNFFDYLMIIWWLFVLNHLDYLMIDYSFSIILIILLFFFYNYSFSIIRDYLMILWFPRQQQVGRQASFPKAFALHSGTSWWWQPVPVGILQPANSTRRYTSSPSITLFCCRFRPSELFFHTCSQGCYCLFWPEKMKT